MFIPNYSLHIYKKRITSILNCLKYYLLYYFYSLFNPLKIILIKTLYYSNKSEIKKMKCYLNIEIFNTILISK